MIDNTPKISIIIPIYNVEPYIAECLQSVMRQTYAGPIECILVDDCGTDKSIEVAEKVIEDYIIANQKSQIKNQISFHILHHEHNRGLSAARNTGTDAATGDYIYYLDSDDYISDDCIEMLTRPLQEYAYDVVIGDMVRFNVEKPKSFLKRESGPLLSQKEICTEYYVKRTLYDAACNKLYKVSVIRKNGLSFLEGQLHEDDLWLYKCCAGMQSAYVQNKITYNYRNTSGSIMNSRLQNIRKRVESIYITADYVLNHPIDVSDDMWSTIAAHYMDMFVMATNGRLEFLKQYKSLRELTNVRPIKSLIKGKLSHRELKHQIHLMLPPIWGLFYVKVWLFLRIL